MEISLRFLYSSGGSGGGGAVAGFGVWVCVDVDAGAAGGAVCGVCAKTVIDKIRGKTTLRTGNFTRSLILTIKSLGAPRND